MKIPVYPRSAALLTVAALALSGFAANAQIIIFGNVADAEVDRVILETTTGPYDEGGTAIFGLSDQSGVRTGRRSYLSPNATNASTVFVFQLPTLGAGESFSNVSVTLTGNGGGIFGWNIDAYGLGQRAASTVLLSDFYQGATVDPMDATLLLDNFVTSGNSIANMTTATISGSAVTNYLNTQYAGGANAGNYVFIRLSPDNNNPITVNANNQAWWMADATGSNASYRPTLSYTAVPKPGTAALLLAGLVALVALRRRSFVGVSFPGCGQAAHLHCRGAFRSNDHDDKHKNSMKINFPASKLLSTAAALIVGGLALSQVNAAVVNVDFNAGSVGTYSGQGALSDPGNNYWNGGSASGSNLLTSDGLTVTSVGFGLYTDSSRTTLTTAFDSQSGGTAVTGDARGGLLNDYARIDSFQGPSNLYFRISGLQPGGSFDLYLYATPGRQVTGGSLGGATGTRLVSPGAGVNLDGLDADLNSNNDDIFTVGVDHAVLIGVVADSNGYIEGTFTTDSYEHGGFNGFQISGATIPEPGTAALLLAGLVALVALRRRSS